jgi:hypothetical protein
MTNIQRLIQTVSELREWIRPTGLEVAPVDCKRWTNGWKRNEFSAALIACALIAPGFPVIAWSADLPDLLPVSPRMVVAAGVGYENAETSTITVKTYDAENGAILSDETYELNVREDAASAAGQPRERIFAGGVGPGSDGLSEFTLRVYDAATGRFLWEGILNLNAGDQESGTTHRVMAYLAAPRATATQINSHRATDSQPHFFLRAVDSATGQLMWTDHFSTETGRLARPERVGRAAVGQTDGDGVSVSSQQIEFRIRMTDDRGRKILWEDTIEPTVEETDVIAGRDDAAEILPAWHGAEYEEMDKDLI